MADEQTIYLSPEEELTSVRERLERTQARRITLVIPQQTQLRSHVGWRLIHARMRELGKELLVISPDRQVRAVARAAGFRVAETQESPSNRPRLGSSTRPGNPNTRGNTRSRLGGSRGGPESRGSQPSGGRRHLTPAARNQANYDNEITIERPGQEHLKPESKQPDSPTTFFEEPGRTFGPPYDFQITTTPSVRPSLPHVEAEEEDEDLKYYDDYTTAQNIRESASKGNKDLEKEAAGKESSMSAPGRRGFDPYAYLADERQRSPLPEQRGSFHGLSAELGTGVPDISDRSTEIMGGEIEDLGDMGAVELPEMQAEPEQPPTRSGGQEPRLRSHTGQMQTQQRHSPRAPRPEAQDFQDDEDLLALPNRPAGRPSQGLAGSSTRSSKALPSAIASQPRVRQRPTPIAMPSAQATRRAPNRQLMPMPGAISSPPQKPRRNNRGLTFALALLIVLLLATGLIFYFVPTATVTIALPPQAFSQTVHLNATIIPQSNLPGKVPAQKLQQDFSASGQGTASGNTSVGNARAHGLVTFTNNGNADVTIPTGTIIATPSGLQFTTEAEAVIPQGGNLPAVPVNAQQAGDSGNVPAKSITTIPSASISSIAQYNHTNTSNINLAVNNPQPTSGGGATNVPAVTTRDLQALVRTLHKKLQQEVNDWLNTQLHPGDIRGVPVPNVPGSSGPLTQEQLSGAPGSGQAAPNGTFTGTLTLHVSVLVARASDVQAATAIQLNLAALNLRPAFELAPQLPIKFSQVHSTSSADGSSLAITAKATGEIIQQLSKEDLSNALTGKGISQAQEDLSTSLHQAGIQNTSVQIRVVPGFLSILPLRADHIQIILQPSKQTPPKSVPNG